MYAHGGASDDGASTGEADANDTIYSDDESGGDESALSARQRTQGAAGSYDHPSGGGSGSFVTGGPDEVGASALAVSTASEEAEREYYAGDDATEPQRLSDSEDRWAAVRMSGAGAPAAAAAGAPYRRAALARDASRALQELEIIED